MRAPGLYRLRGGRRAVAVALLTVGLALSACHPPIGGTASEGAVAGGTADPVAGAPPPSAGRPTSGTAASPVGEEAPLSHFGLLTPLFPGVGAQSVSAPCQPDDFYGGCL